ncbi:hypothetical protein LOC67_23390 [Stieleria sp. JC731]|uniref:hypothetical protein n=1 Tax=Pirellulaceae TaxID=2691357 RepID=UPI001E5B0464|nr:hypothetical protein [Stieleria sp. JC731]MCC9603504.1 hypothetical protein [Stieleria sp. JC731]
MPSAIENAEAALASVMTNTEMFAETITLYSQGDMDSPQSINADVSWADEEGSNSVRGDGRSSLNQDRGKSVRQTCTIEMPSSVSINENGRDIIKVTDPSGSEVYVNLHRRAGADPVSQTLVCVRTNEFFSQRGRRGG